MAPHKLTWLHLYRLAFLRTPLIALPPFNTAGSDSTSLSSFRLVFIYLFALNLYICCPSAQNGFPHFVLLEMPTHLIPTA